MPEPGQKGYGVICKWRVAFQYDEWFLEIKDWDEIYYPGDCRKRIISYFGWHNDNMEEAKQWLINKNRKEGIALENVKFIHKTPWINLEKKQQPVKENK